MDITISEKLKKAKLYECFQKYNDKVINIYQNIIETYPHDFRAYFNLAILLSKKTRLELSVNDIVLDIINYNKVDNIQSNSNDNHENFYIAYYLFKKVIELQPNIIESYGSIAGLLIKLFKPLKAISYCQRGLSLVHNDRSCLYNINIAYRQTNQMNIAIELCWDVFEQNCLSNTDYKAYLIPNNVLNNNPIIDQSSLNMKQTTTTSITNLTIICVKWGSKYSFEYVNNLYNAILRHLSANNTTSNNTTNNTTSSDNNTTTTNNTEKEWDNSTFTNNISSLNIKMVCYTDDFYGIDERIQCFPFNIETHSWVGWWYKAQIFAPNPVLYGWLLYIDLDTVIINSLSFISTTIYKLQEYLIKQQQKDSSTSSSSSSIENILEFDYTNIIMTLNAKYFKNEARSDGINSSMLFWYVHKEHPNIIYPSIYQTLYDFLIHYYHIINTVIYKFDHYLEMMLYSNSSVFMNQLNNNILDQNTILCYFFQDIHPNYIIDYNNIIIPSILSTTTTSTFHSKDRHSDNQDCHSTADNNNTITYNNTITTATSNSTTTATKVISLMNKNINFINHLPSKLNTIICFPLEPKPHELVNVDYGIHIHWSSDNNI